MREIVTRAATELYRNVERAFNPVNHSLSEVDLGRVDFVTVPPHNNNIRTRAGDFEVNTTASGARTLEATSAQRSPIDLLAEGLQRRSVELARERNSIQVNSQRVKNRAVGGEYTQRVRIDTGETYEELQQESEEFRTNRFNTVENQLRDKYGKIAFSGGTFTVNQTDLGALSPGNLLDHGVPYHDKAYVSKFTPFGYKRFELDIGPTTAHASAVKQCLFVKTDELIPHKIKELIGRVNYANGVNNTELRQFLYVRRFHQNNPIDISSGSIRIYDNWKELYEAIKAHEVSKLNSISDRLRNSGAEIAVRQAIAEGDLFFNNTQYSRRNLIKAWAKHYTGLNSYSYQRTLQVVGGLLLLFTAYSLVFRYATLGYKQYTLSELWELDSWTKYPSIFIRYLPIFASDEAIKRERRERRQRERARELISWVGEGRLNIVRSFIESYHAEWLLAGSPETNSLDLEALILSVGQEIGFDFTRSRTLLIDLLEREEVPRLPQIFEHNVLNQLLPAVIAAEAH
ncbi:hypothetical protein 1 [Beihai victori-like virus 1]|uniref:hypothetical protein 1 n=1 Tax=Beihai victori-like virus 1 TaxID=1922737 RepID=UPI00090B66B5|nr:hypothetical protein 1 [Beihai victori-like virus 1]APG75992.1 hypothetical protein 1 [Beihai victori-like virus 1]